MEDLENPVAVLQDTGNFFDKFQGPLYFSVRLPPPPLSPSVIFFYTIFERYKEISCYTTLLFIVNLTNVKNLILGPRMLMLLKSLNYHRFLSN